MNENRTRTSHVIATTLLLVISLLLLWIQGCASITGVTKWKERFFTTSVAPDSAYAIAARALASTGRVSFADKATLTVTGECAQQVDAAISVTQREGKTVILLKSKLNVKENSMVIETGDRAKCIMAIADQIRAQGLELIEVKSE